MKRAISLLLAILMIFGMFSSVSFTSNAAEIETEKVSEFSGDYEYTLFSNDTVEIKEKTSFKIALKAVGTTLNTVEVKERMKSSYISKMSLEQKEIISAEGLKHLACCNLGESFENSASVDVGYSDAVSGSKQIQLLGLTGVYSQLLLENMPFLRGLSAPFGLGYVPGSWMESISVSKGVATVKHGYETITGIIDLEYEKPNKGDLFSLNAYVNNEMKGELSAKLNHIINDKLSTGFYIYGTSNQLKAYDHLGTKPDGTHGDGFMDYPKHSQFNIVNRWTYEVPDGLCSQTMINYTHEDRVGGQMDFDKSMRGDSTIYGLGGTTDRIHFFTKNGAPINNVSSFGTQVSATYFKQDAFYGLSNYKGTEGDVYANVLVNSEIWRGHSVDFGASFRYSDTREDLYSMPYLGAVLFNSNDADLKANFFKQEEVRCFDSLFKRIDFYLYAYLFPAQDH